MGRQAGRSLCASGVASGKRVSPQSLSFPPRRAEGHVLLQYWPCPAPTHPRRVLRGGRGGTCQPGPGPCFASILSSWVTPSRTCAPPEPQFPRLPNGESNDPLTGPLLLRNENQVQKHMESGTAVRTRGLLVVSSFELEIVKPFWIPRQSHRVSGLSDLRERR